MLSDEEKDNVFKISVPIITNEELERFNNYLETDLDKIVNEISTHISRDREIILLKKVIEKQYKEIEELKNITKSYDSFLGDEKIVIADKKFFVNGYFQENFVRKDKIKAKIEYLLKRYDSEEDFCSYDVLISILQSLLEKE